MKPSHWSLLVFLGTHFLLIDSKLLTYTHYLVLYECDKNSVIYQFQNDSQATPQIKDPHGVFVLHSFKTHHEVVANRSNLKTGFKFTITIEELTVEIQGEIRQCDQVSSDSKCTIVISILASISLLLFAAFALSLIVLKEKKILCIDKLTNWWQNRSKDNNKSSSNGGLDLDSLRRIHENGLRQGASEEPDIEDSPPINVKNLPRKSSLKPPRVDAFPIPPRAPENNVSIDPSTVRRKSIVTFNERTEIRS